MALKDIINDALNKMAPPDILNSSENIKSKSDEIDKLFEENLNLKYKIKDLKDELKDERAKDIHRNRIQILIIISQAIILTILLFKLIK
jgi:cell division protein FtsB